MKQWNWHRILYWIAILLGFLAGPLFGDTGRLAAIAAGGAFLIWYAWKRTKFRPSLREAVAGLFPSRERRILLRLLALLVLLGLGAMPAVYYYGVTGSLIASGVAVVACLVFAWRVRRSAQVSPEPQRGESSPVNGDAGTR